MPFGTFSTKIDSKDIVMSNGEACIEASSLRLPPGAWPNELVMMDERLRRWHYTFVRFNYVGDDMASGEYHRETGNTPNVLIVWND